MTKQSARYFAVKVEVLKFYGPNKECRCSVYGCDVYDPDMLTLDHPNDDGAKELVQGKNHHRAVRDYYGHRKNLVEGSRHTMCWNHNNKKELMRRRKDEWPPIILTYSHIRGKLRKGMEEQLGIVH